MGEVEGARALPNFDHVALDCAQPAGGDRGQLVLGNELELESVDVVPRELNVSKRLITL